MTMRYEVISPEKVECIQDMCNELMRFQQSKATITPERFDGMSFETRMIPSMESAVENYLMIVRDKENIVGYVYCNISEKEVYDNDFATFFDMASVSKEHVGCLSQFYIKEGYRGAGIGSVLFEKAMAWLTSFDTIEDIFIYVSNGNDDALQFYQNKGFQVTHQILDGFITVLRNVPNLSFHEENRK
ncbi:GNAT family N-acetyltransferase [Vallitalea pronyensis]|uniref:GNAT family N-acetyltransferase n=2 Tax=Vallitalea pronyensis TaxID=1348613 RepID=A0A8J8MJ83_9FIRM|nr:GNAT family N-acetyltransferase [Vallitalea pronyensis]